MLLWSLCGNIWFSPPPPHPALQHCLEVTVNWHVLLAERSRTSLQSGEPWNGHVSDDSLSPNVNSGPLAAADTSEGVSGNVWWAQAPQNASPRLAFN